MGVDRAHKVGVPLEGVGARARGEVPALGGLVVCARVEGAVVGADRAHNAGVPLAERP